MPTDILIIVALVSLNLLLTFVVFCCLRALWARMPEREPSSFTVGDVANEWRMQQAGLRANPPKLTPEEQAQVAAYRAKWKGVITDDQPDLEVLALSRINPA